MAKAPRVTAQSSEVHSDRTGTLTKLIMIILLVGISHAGAQEAIRAEMGGEPPPAGLMIAQKYDTRGAESILFQMPAEGTSRQSSPRSFVNGLREEMKSLGHSLPDLSLSLLGFSWYVRNPLRYRLSPGSTYAHQMGFSNGDWSLTVDGIKTNTFENLDIALQWPVSTGMNLFVRYTDMQYRLDLQAFGKLPWE